MAKKKAQVEVPRPVVGAKEKAAAIEITKKQIEKDFGKGAFMKLGDTEVVAVDVIPSGSILIDEALGAGGYPRGRIIEIYGAESSGKTTLALHAIAEAQRLGGIAAFIDAEHALDASYARALGVNTDDLWVSQPDTGEQALSIVDQLVRSGAVDIIVVDSVAALTPQAEIEGDMGDSHMGLQARLMSQALRKLTSIISKSQCCVIFINQTRMKIGVMFGNPETTAGGNALKFYATQRIEVKRGQKIVKNEEAIGSQTYITIVKNKVAPPFKKVNTEIIFGEGFSKVAALIEAGVNYELIDKAGTWYSYKGERLGQGKEAVKTFISEHPEIIDELDTELRKIIFAHLLEPKAGDDVLGDGDATADRIETEDDEA